MVVGNFILHLLILMLSSAISDLTLAQNRVQSPGIVAVKNAHAINTMKPTVRRQNRTTSRPTLRTAGGHQMGASASALSQMPSAAPTLLVSGRKMINDDDSSESSSNMTHYEWETILVRKLFNRRRYNPQVRPAVSDRLPVEVSIELVLLQINEMIEKDQEIVISGFLKIKWRDVRLSWSSSEFGGIDWVVTESTNCWLPDLALINSNDVYAVTRDIRFPLTLNSSGDILYVPAGKIYARCELNLQYFPFDYQLCKYRFESWAYAAELVRIVGHNFTIEPEHYMQNPEWDVPDAFVRTEIIHYETYNFSRVDFFMLLKRKSLFFITYTIFPCMALSTLQMMSHMLPFTEPERINFATTTLIAFSVFHVSIVEQMPHSSDAIPLLAIFVDALMCLIGLSLVECFIMMNWLSKVGGYSVPSPRSWFLVVDRFGDYLWLGSTGNYWRRNYLYVYERLNHKLDLDRRRRELERQRWKSASYQYKLRRSSKFGQTKDQANFEALLYLVEKGDRRRDAITIPPLPAMNLQPQAADYNANTTAASTVAGVVNEHQPDSLRANKSSANLPNEGQAQRPSTPTKLGDVMSARSVSASNLLSPGSPMVNETQRLLSPASKTHSSNIDYDMDYGDNNKNRLSVIENERFRLNSESSAESIITTRSKAAANYLSKLNTSRREAAAAEARDKFAAMGYAEGVKGCSLSPMTGQHATSSSNRRSPNGQKRSKHPSKSHRRGDKDNKSKHKSPSLLKASLLASVTTAAGATAAATATSIVTSAVLNAAPEMAETSLTYGGCESSQRTPISPNKRNNNPIITSPEKLRPYVGDSPSGSYCRLDYEAQSQHQQQEAQQPSQSQSQSQQQDAAYCLASRHSCRIDDIRNLVEEMSTHITNNELKKECIGVWTTYITVIDRMLSMLLCMLCISFPIYLFVLFPEKPHFLK